MAQLIVRDVDEAVVAALKKRAAARRMSTEALHRQILEEAVRAPKRRSMAQALAAMPNVGLDSDFERSPRATRRS